MHHSSACPRRPFTLIELLTVVSIMIIILAMLMPTLSKAREKARGSVCANNFKTLGMAFRMYGADYESYIAPSGLQGAGGHAMAYDEMDWSGPIGQFYVPTDKSFICPTSVTGGQPATQNGGMSATVNSDGNAWQTIGPVTARYAIGSEATMTPTLGTLKVWTVARKSYAINIAFGMEAGADNTVMAPVKDLDAVSPEGEILLAESLDELCAFARNNFVVSSLSVGGITVSGARLPTDQMGLVLTAATPANAVAYKAVLRSAAVGSGNCLAQPHVAGIAWDQHQPRSLKADSATADQGRAYYLMLDGHTEFMTLTQTLSDSNFMWGKKLYAWIDRPKVLDSSGTNPVR